MSYYGIFIVVNIVLYVDKQAGMPVSKLGGSAVNIVSY